MPRSVACPTCAKQMLWSLDNPWRPFCSERCKQIDLGAWASDAYRIAGRTDENSPSDDDRLDRDL